MNKIKIGVVEDEVIIADSICATLKQLGYDFTEPVTSYTEALAMMEEEKPDLMLLDINLAGNKDGIDLAAEIKKRYDIPFIFLTANSDPETIERAKKVEPPAYLVKPFNKNELFTSIEICLSNFTKQKHKREAAKIDNANFIINDAIFIKDGYNFIKVFFKDIYYLQSEHVYVKVITRDKEFLIRSSLQSYAENFPSSFFRIGRSHIVNVEHIQKMDGSSVTIHGNELPMAKQFRDELMKVLRLG